MVTPIAPYRALYYLCARRWAYCLYLELMQISRDQLTELTEVIEDTVEYFCDKERVSGELAWTVVESLGTAKLAELKGLIVADPA